MKLKNKTQKKDSIEKKLEDGIKGGG